NPTGPITVAAARNGAYGDCVARLLEFGGDAVQREYYYNDAGAQMDSFRASVEARRRGEEPPEDGYRGAYVDDLAAAEDDPVTRMLGYDPDRVEVLLYQLVHLTRGGQQTKMSKRRGDVVFLDELVDEIGVDAARWYLVNRGPDQTIEIDVDLAAERTQKNPVY